VSEDCPVELKERRESVREEEEREGGREKRRRDEGTVSSRIQTS
jgi:hypothetical protein